MINKKSSLLPISAYYSLIYMSNGAFTSYIGLYYAAISLGNTEIGLLTSLSAIVTIIAQPVWGTIGDRASLKNRVLMLCLLLTGVSIWLVPLSAKTLWLLAIFIAVFNFFHCAVGPLSDTITLELSSRQNFKFSNIRTVGSLGYALMAAVAGKIFDSDITRMFPVFSLFMFLAFGLSFFIPHVEGHQRSSNKVKLWKVFESRELVVIYIYTFLIQMTMGFFYSFNSVYSKQQGISTQLIGIGVMIGSFSQFPFMLFFNKIYTKLGIKNILLLSGIIHCIRWGLYATALNPTTIMFLWALHGCTFIVFYLCLAEYINNNIAKELKTSGQMMNSLIINGVSRIFGGFLGGILSSALGIGQVFMISSIVCMIAVVGFYISIKNVQVSNYSHKNTYDAQY